MTDVTILNTRPLAQQQETNKIFKQYGFNIINFPCIEIQETDVPHKAKIQLEQIQANDVIIFTSQHAVQYAFQLNFELNFDQNTVIAVGRKTAECLEQNTTATIFTPQKQNSKGVIELLKGLNSINSIQLVTAPNGRAEIQNYVQLNTIPLTQINVYQRVLPKTLSPDIFKQIKQVKELYTLATSSTTLDHLKQLIPVNLWPSLLARPLLCASQRIQQYAQKMGFITTYNVETANPEIMVQQIKEIF